MTATAPTVSAGQTISITKTGFLGNVPPEILAITFNSIGGVKLAYDSTDVYKTNPVTPTTFPFNGALPAIPRSDFNSVWRWIYTDGGFQFPITRSGVGTKGFFNGSGSSDPVFYESGLEFTFGTPSQTKIYRWPAVCVVGGNVSINTSRRQDVDPSEFNLMRPKTQNWNTKGPIIRFIGSDIKFSDYSLWSLTGSIPSGKWPGWLYEIPITLWDASRTGQSVTNYLRFVVYN
jgi:hypothetical protein